MSPASFPLARIDCEADAWPRADLDAGRVRLFADLYEAEGPDRLPPIEIVPTPTGRYIVADGWTRIAAADKVGLTELPAVILDCPFGAHPVEVAYLRAVETASTGPRTLTRAERRTAVERVIALDPEMSDREVGRLVGVAHTTVARVRSGGGALHQSEGDDARDATEMDIARRLFRSIEKVWDARGLGIGDAIFGDRTGERLAAVLHDALGDHAIDRAIRYRRWLDEAITTLEHEGATDGSPS